MGLREELYLASHPVTDRDGMGTQVSQPMPGWWEELAVPIFQPLGLKGPWGNPGHQCAWLGPSGQASAYADDWSHLGCKHFSDALVSFPVLWVGLGEGQQQALDRISLSFCHKGMN